MKRLTVFALALLLVFGFVSCTDEPTEEPSADVETTETSERTEETTEREETSTNNDLEIDWTKNY